MKIGILCASDEELAPFLPCIEGDTVTEHAKLRFHCGKIGGADVVAVFSGVCKVNAAIAAQLLIERFGAELVLNAGTAGGMAPSLELLDTVISTEVVYHDVAPFILTQFHPWMETEFFRADEKLLAASHRAAETLDPARRVIWGRMATGEAFIDSEGRADVNRRYSPLCVDMESAGVAHVCYAFDVPFLSIRSLSDTADHRGVENFEANSRAASEASRDVTLALIRQLNA